MLSSQSEQHVSPTGSPNFYGRTTKSKEEMREEILRSLEDCTLAIEQLKKAEALLFLEKVASLLANAFRAGNKVIIAGNGGSLCDASHFAEELTGIFRGKRAPLPAIALTEPGFLTCVANDLGFASVFARGVEAYGVTDDVFIALTTSGNSPNILLALEKARSLGLQTVAFLGKEGGKARGSADYELLIEGFQTSDRIQEAHMAALHILVEMVEHLMFASSSSIPTTRTYCEASKLD
jgi:D-sedoheptulose 7-phosphate isomerase